MLKYNCYLARIWPQNRLEQTPDNKSLIGGDLYLSLQCNGDLQGISGTELKYYAMNISTGPIYDISQQMLKC